MKQLMEVRTEIKRRTRAARLACWRPLSRRTDPVVTGQDCGGLCWACEMPPDMFTRRRKKDAIH